MDEWAKVVIYPLGFGGFALYLMWRAHVRADKARQRGYKVDNTVFNLFAAIALLAGITLATIDKIPVRTNGPASDNTDNPVPRPRSAGVPALFSGRWLMTEYYPNGAPGATTVITFSGNNFEWVQGVQGEVTLRGTWTFRNDALDLHYTEVPGRSAAESVQIALFFNAMMNLHFVKQQDNTFVAAVPATGGTMRLTQD